MATVNSGRLMFRPRFPVADTARWAARFPDDGSDAGLLDGVRPLVLARGYVNRAEFLKVCAWKSARTKPACRKNSARKIETLTRAAFATPDEALKIGLLRLLDGVEWPTASTILHFCDARPYPILDYRALWSLGFDKHRGIRWSSGWRIWTTRGAWRIG
jgi:hypothetical protein